VLFNITFLIAMPQHGPETAGVSETNEVCAKLEIDVVVLGRWLVAGQDAQVPGHA
jgi:hypothetical protein